MQKTCTEIIDETLAAGYTRSNRGIDKDRCYYIAPGNGVMCAVGRCCEAPQSEWIGSFTRLRLSENDDCLSPADRESLLKPEYRGHPAFFWTDLQDLHDEWENWNETGLSTVGEIKVTSIREKWCQHDS